MGDIANDILDGVFCQECGDFIGNPVGFPRTCQSCSRDFKRVKEKPKRNIMSKSTLCIVNMCKDRGLNDSERTKLVADFLHSKGYKQLPKAKEQYEIIHSQYKNSFKKYLIEYVNNKKL